uniref:Regulator of telomere elongation helicase 1-like n=1 Tax=Saccoglossus kowalevskii TaxID=10224 RepID=A0ABM0M5Y9_SACKO
FAKSDTKAQLPSWVRPYTQTYENFGILMRDLINFFRTTERIMPKPKLKSRESHMTCETTSSKALPVVSKPLVSSFTSASSYSSRTKSVVDDASNIVSHVPSLRKPEKAVYEAKLKIMYENSAGTSINLKTRSLLDALEQDNQMTSEVDDDIINSPQALRYKEALHKRLIEQGKKNSVKKKIVVVNPFLSKEMESKTELSGTTKRKSSNDSKDSTQSSSSTSTIVPAKIYLSKVKDRLTSGAYQRFSELMQQYKFYRFVKPCHKKDFDILCKGLTGLGCGYKPEHSLRRDTLKKAKQHGSNGS